MLKYQPLDLPQCVWRQATVSGKDYGIKPEFALAIGRSDMDMRWFASLVRVKVESKRANSQYRGHFKGDFIGSQRRKYTTICNYNEFPAVIRCPCYPNNSGASASPSRSSHCRRTSDRPYMHSSNRSLSRLRTSAEAASFSTGIVLAIQ